jgi:DNA gyrase/topoisomerase IV subunit A
MKTNDLRKQKTAYYRWQKSRLEALLAVVQRKYEFIEIIRRSKNEKDVIESVVSHFNISLRQAHYLLGLELRQLGALKYEEIQKEYEEVLRYYQILAPNNKKL